ncbi:DNA glycosylase [Frederiksenia canicola]|uniref:DNA glycosylase n=1 Tax=Frederiksenia canicola TaxID=123824 RepID=A0AAE6X5R6_9PAST|nr:DNA glycosylase [Frederiksenia canicola]QIM65153.1 DNA glycosylase [Frederiksenia canicola]RPE96423.1 G/U mismatch-specific uracil-DNA glycosylase [Frederiksenia canicola]
MKLIEIHPFPPILPPNATIMMMGTFPPKPEKRSMDFYYPNFQNDMWRIYGEIFFGNPNHFIIPNDKRFDPDKILQFLYEKGIALCPTVTKAIREQDNASDKFLTVVEKVDLNTILAQVPHCRWLFTTGGKATDILLELLPNKVKSPKTNDWIDYPFGNFDLKLYRLPSTSRAYPLSFTKKVEAYRHFFITAGLI